MNVKFVKSKTAPNLQKNNRIQIVYELTEKKKLINKILKFDKTYFDLGFFQNVTVKPRPHLTNIW